MSPYTGSNLGDAGIIEAARFQLGRFFPEAELVLIVLDCGRVSGLHGLRAFPLTAVKRSFYSYSSREADEGAPDGRKTTGRDRLAAAIALKSKLKKIAGHVPLARDFVRLVRDAPRAMVKELGHLRRVVKLMRRLDGLIVAGGGQFDDEFGGPLGHPYALFKWVSRASKKRIPVFFAGVGVCEVDHALTKWFIKRTIKSANRVSLRDQGSIDLLRGLGIRSGLFSCPDLAFGLPVGEGRGYPQAAAGSTSHIGLSPIAYGKPGSWPTEKRASFDRYWGEFRELGLRLLGAGHRVTLFVTDDADIDLAKELFDQLVNDAPQKERLSILSDLTLPELRTALQDFDAVIAGRLHGVLLSHISGVPTLGISYHRKVRAHMADMDQGQYCLDFSTFTAPGAMTLLDGLLRSRRAIIAQLETLCRVKREAVDREFMIMAGELAPKERPLMDCHEGKS